MAIVRDRSGNVNYLDQSYPSLSVEDQMESGVGIYAPPLIQLPKSFYDLGIIPDDPTAALSNSTLLNAAIQEYNSLRAGEGDYYFNRTLNFDALSNKELSGAGHQNTSFLFDPVGTYTLDRVGAGRPLFLSALGTSFADPINNLILRDFKISPTRLITHIIRNLENDGAGTATLETWRPHGYITGEEIFVALVVETEYNGSAICTVLDETHISYPIVGTPTTPATFNDAAPMVSLLDFASGVIIGMEDIINSFFDSLHIIGGRNAGIWCVDSDSLDFHKIITEYTYRGINLDGGSSATVRAQRGITNAHFSTVIWGNDTGTGSTSGRDKSEIRGSVVSDGVYIENFYPVVDFLTTTDNTAQNCQAIGFHGYGPYGAFQMKGVPASTTFSRGNKFIGCTADGFPYGFQCIYVGGGQIIGGTHRNNVVISSNSFGVHCNISERVIITGLNCDEYDGVASCVYFNNSSWCQLDGLALKTKSGASTGSMVGVRMVNADNCKVDSIDVSEAGTGINIDAASDNNQFGPRIRVSTAATGLVCAANTQSWPVQYNVEIPLSATGIFAIALPPRGLTIGSIQSVITVASTVDTAVSVVVGTIADNDKFVASVAVTPLTRGTRQDYTLASRNAAATETILVEVTGAGDAGSKALFSVRGFYGV